MMINEVAEFYIKEGAGAAFERALRESTEKYISSTEGYIGSQLHRSIEDPSRYLLLIQWESVEAHTVNFRESEVFPKHRALISPYFEKPPFVQHFEQVSG